MLEWDIAWLDYVHCVIPPCYNKDITYRRQPHIKQNHPPVLSVAIPIASNILTTSVRSIF